MVVPQSYFVVQARIPHIMEAIQKAGVPEKFTLAFLESMGFKSTNDRPIIAMLKSIGFLDSNGIPTASYRAYKDPNNSKRILGQSLKETYKDIFLANEKANTLSVENLKGIFASTSGKGESVAIKMAQTFKAFSSLADFDSSNNCSISTEEPKNGHLENTPPLVSSQVPPSTTKSAEFHYNIQIHLPTTRDITVYNAIFKSLKDHLL